VSNCQPDSLCKELMMCAQAKQSAAHRLGISLLFAGLLALHVMRAQSEPSSADTIETRMLACTSCHGQQGRGTNDAYVPRLAGKPAGYLYNQLTAFRGGRRHYSPMNYLLEFQTNAYLHAMADYFARQKPPFPPHSTVVANSAVLTRGQTLTAYGDGARRIPACAGCHNPEFTGMEPAIPGLLGLQPIYISAQLGAWRYGTRTAAVPDCMQEVAGRLTEDDVTAVAAWLSSLPAPLDSTPVPRGTLITPLPCGSEPN
jgi:cytochrome c553